MFGIKFVIMQGILPQLDSKSLTGKICCIFKSRQSKYPVKSLYQGLKLTLATGQVQVDFSLGA